MNTSEVLNKAADLIEQRGWRQGDGWVREGDPDNAGLCLEGGIMAVLGLRMKDGAGDSQFAPLLGCPAYKAVSKYLDREEATVSDEMGFDGEPLYWWNDEVARDAAQVVEVLRATAVIEAARETADVRERVAS